MARARSVGAPGSSASDQAVRRASDGGPGGSVGGRRPDRWCPTTAARASRNLVPALLSASRRRAGVDPRRRPRRTPGGACWSSTGWAPTARRTAPHRAHAGHGPRANDRQRRPDDDGDRAHVDHHRAPRPVSTGSSATRSASAARSSTRCGGRATRATPANRIEPDRAPADRAVRWGPSHRWCRQAQFADSGFTRGASARRRTTGPTGSRRSIPVEVAAALGEGRPVRLRLLRRHRQDRPHHGLRPALRRRAGHRRPASSPDPATALPAGAALVVTADHGQVHVGDGDRSHSARASCALTAAVSGEARFVWLHAQAAAARRRSRRPQRRARRRRVGACRSTQVLDEALVRSGRHPAAAARLGDVALVAHEPVALVIRPVPARVLQTRHGSLTPDEIEVPLAVVVAGVTVVRPLASAPMTLMAMSDGCRAPIVSRRGRDLSRGDGARRDARKTPRSSSSNRPR